ncbi:serine hydrolase domain-containing protein [Streptomyces huiliensis]|uniref:serine hydrolase domain-containing protein n=1 Tax=Streptomyces huiliensis TaxID=2876027 RepID=UPI001CBCF50E|nr:serine hydrolase domain-containing protein [Streptomyces huiliensis]MBZ4322536.1 beta-lactamase family protein [Streptomyces huiliensis]
MPRLPRHSLASATAVTALLTAVAVTASAAPALAAPARYAPSTTGSPAHHRPTAERTALQRALDAVTAEGVPGVVAEVRDEHGVWRGASGSADRESGRPARADDRFRVGSVTKSLVATVVLQLVAEDRLKLDEPVERHLPVLVPAGPNGERVTVRQLLNHTSGLPDYLTDVLVDLSKPKEVVDRLREVGRTTYAPRELVGKAVALGWKFAPGEKGAWSYSNTNYVVLGLLVEHVTGRTLAQEITGRVIRPLGLRDTSFPTTARMPGRHLNGYEWAPGAAAPVDFTTFDPSAIWSTGTVISTAHDLNTFFRALSGGRLLPPHLTEEMRRAIPMGKDRAGRSYGLGLETDTRSCGPTAPVRGHSGSVAGYNTFSFGTADGKRQVTIAMNRNFSKSPAADGAAARFLTAALCPK